MDRVYTLMHMELLYSLIKRRRIIASITCPVQSNHISSAEASSSQKTNNNITIDLGIQVEADLCVEVEVDLDLQGGLLIGIIEEFSRDLETGVADGSGSTSNELATPGGAVGLVVGLVAAAADGTRLGGNANRWRRVVSRQFFGNGWFLCWRTSRDGFHWSGSRCGCRNKDRRRKRRRDRNRSGRSRSWSRKSNRLRKLDRGRSSRLRRNKSARLFSRGRRSRLRWIRHGWLEDRGLRLRLRNHER